MKKLFIILAALFSTILSAQTPAVQIPLAAGITPFSPFDTYPLQFSKYGFGGWKEVQRITERDSITTQRRSKGMAVWVNDSNALYVLQGGITNANWVKFAGGGGGGGSADSSLFATNYKLSQSIYDRRMTAYGKYSAPAIFGREYLYAIHNKLRNGGQAVFMLAGNSTVQGASITEPEYYPHFLLPRMFANDLPNVSVINKALSGSNTVDWITNPTLLDAQIAAHPDCFIICYGINDGANNRTNFRTTLRAGLQRIRDSLPVWQTSIVLGTPISTNDVATGRDRYWYDSIQVVIREAARDYQCMFIDRATSFWDTRNAAGHWMDMPYMDRDTVAVHPLETMNVNIWSQFYEEIVPRGIKAIWGSTNFINNTYAANTVTAATIPPNFAKGTTYTRAVLADGWPLDGMVKTDRQNDGVYLQTNSSYTQSRVMVRTGVGNSWNSWVENLTTASEVIKGSNDAFVITASMIPATFGADMYINRATPANGFPLDGYVITEHSTGGAYSQRLYSYLTSDAKFRTGGTSAWNDWTSILTDSSAVVRGGNNRTTISSSTVPATFGDDLYINRATTANGFPQDGEVVTIHQKDGIWVQHNTSYINSGYSYRTGSAGGWNAWQLIYSDYNRRSNAQDDALFLNGGQKTGDAIATDLPTTYTNDIIIKRATPANGFPFDGLVSTTMQTGGVWVQTNTSYAANGFAYRTGNTSAWNAWETIYTSGNRRSNAMDDTLFLIGGQKSTALASDAPNTYNRDIVLQRALPANGFPLDGMVETVYQTGGVWVQKLYSYVSSLFSYRTGSGSGWNAWRSVANNTLNVVNVDSSFNYSGLEDIIQLDINTRSVLVNLGNPAFFTGKTVITKLKPYTGSNLAYVRADLGNNIEGADTLYKLINYSNSATFYSDGSIWRIKDQLTPLNRIQTVSSSGTLAPLFDNYTYSISAAGAPLAITLAPSFVGQIIRLIKTDSTANTIVITGAGGFTKTLSLIGDFIEVQWDGTNILLFAREIN